jgi:predicted transcriptional regulator
MSKAEGSKVKRFFIQGTEDLHRRLQHLAIDLDTSAEKLAGKLLAEAVQRAEAEGKADPQKPPKGK